MFRIYLSLYFNLCYDIKRIYISLLDEIFKRISIVITQFYRNYYVPRKNS